jgi:hypothetical protein
MLPLAAMADNDRPVSFEGLPAAAQTFIRDHFPDAKVTLATIDREFMETTYDVIFTDGTQIEFDARGEWKDIDSPRGAFVPQSVLHPGIASFIGEHYPDARVSDIERDRQGYEVNLSNRAELRFDSRGNFRGYDD